MNALELIAEVRAHGAELYVREGRLMVRGRGDHLPADLQQALRQHKPELLAAFGAPMNQISAEIMQDIRPHLPLALRRLRDDQLLVLVNWSIIAAFESAVRNVQR